MPFRNLRFLSELRASEQIYLVLREHWIMPAMKMAFWMIFLVLVGFVETSLRQAIPFFNEETPSMIIETARMVFLITACLGLLITWVMYYLNVQIVTNERIVDINQKSLLAHHTSELNLDRFQDVTTEIVGPLANFFNYGNVRVQTAGEITNFVFNRIANPHRVAKIILELYEKIRKKYPLPPHD